MRLHLQRSLCFSFYLVFLDLVKTQCPKCSLLSRACPPYVSDRHHHNIQSISHQQTFQPRWHTTLPSSVLFSFSTTQNCSSSSIRSLSRHGTPLLFNGWRFRAQTISCDAHPILEREYIKSASVQRIPMAVRRKPRLRSVIAQVHKEDRAR